MTVWPSPGMPPSTRGTGSPRHQCSRTRGSIGSDFAIGSYEGKTLERWQYKITNGGRIWYFVVPTPGAKTAGRARMPDTIPNPQPPYG